MQRRISIRVADHEPRIVATSHRTRSVGGRNSLFHLPGFGQRRSDEAGQYGDDAQPDQQDEERENPNLRS